MSIQLLSDSTSRVLVSTQTLYNATSVIKELVDNALDARASSISIEIAANTLDKIIVKDDGSGIGVQDRQLLCKRGCTSKITNLDDLATLGGTFLGFRGTALASIAELSKELTIVTKVDGEQPATTMTFGANGRLLSSASASHNDGTTVRVEKFLASVPVRQQDVLKNPSKVLDEIKKLLQGYAFARPGVKLSLKVLKTKSDKVNWSFAACRDGEQLVAAAVQIVGKQIASLCKLHAMASADTADSAESHSQYAIKAFLLNAEDTDLSKAGSVGQYMSVDGRPVSHEKGVMKAVVKKYRTYLQKANGSENYVPSKPFLAIDLRCPEGSYDVNIEPAKDVLLFHEQQNVIDLATRLFTQCYGQIEDPNPDTRLDVPTITPKYNTSSFDVLLSRRQPETHGTNGEGVAHESRRDKAQILKMTHTSTVGQSLVESFAQSMSNNPRPINESRETTSSPMTLEMQKAWSPHRNMDTSIADSEDVNTSPYNANGSEVEEEYDPTDVTVNNPFIRARISSLHHKESRRKDDQQAPTGRPGLEVGHFENETQPARSETAASRASLNIARGLPSPQTSPFALQKSPYQNPGPPFPRRNKRAYDEDDCEDQNIEDYPSPLQQPPGPRRSDLVGWVRSPNSASLPSFQGEAEDNIHDQPVGQQTTPSRPTMNGVVRGATRQQFWSMNKPFQSPLKQARPSSSTGSGPSTYAGTSQIVSPTTSLRSTQPLQQTDDDLQYILEFEQQKKLVNRQRRLNQATLNPADLARIQKSSDVAADLILSRSSQPRPNRSDEGSNDSPVSQSDIDSRFEQADTSSHSPSLTIKRSNPHQNRYLAAVRRLQPPNDQAAPSQPPQKPDTGNDERQQRSQPATSHPNISLEDSPPALLPTDSRGYLISLQPYRDHNNLPSPERSKHSIKRIKSSRLPFESIPTSAAKNHTLLAVPATPFPPLTDASVTVSSLSKYDSYVKTGKNNFVDWSTSTSIDEQVAKWQKTLEMLVGRCFREGPEAEAEADDGGSIRTKGKRDAQGSTETSDVNLDVASGRIALTAALQALNREHRPLS